MAFLKTKLDIEMINEHARTMKLLMMNLAMLDPCSCHDPSVRIKKKKVTFTNSTKMSIRTNITNAEALVEALQTATKAVIDSKNGILSFRRHKPPIIRGWEVITKRL